MAGFIEYKGILKDFESLNEFIEEVIDISSIMKWEYEVFENDLKGICFTPPQCDAIIFSLNEEGIITKPWHRKLPKEGNIKIIKVEINLDEDTIKPKITEGNADEISHKMNEMAHDIILKTHYETEEEDEKLVTFINYIGNKYFDEFELEFSKSEKEEDSDKSDLEPLEFLQAMISKFTQQIDKNDIKPNESIMDFIKRIMKDKGEL
jgi:hypothetical protein